MRSGPAREGGTTPASGGSGARPRPALPRRLAAYSSRWARQVWFQRQQVPALDVGRDLAHQTLWSACYAPLTSMYLDQHGKVRACCQNTDHLLGDVATQSLGEIWEGRPAARLRSALGRADFGRGCDFCAWQIAEAGPVGGFARSFDFMAASARHPPRPLQMQFAVSNACNLQCIMCNGDWSSAIRAHREHRPALPAIYGERFFAELEDFIPHLISVTFTGGEPFLGRESLRIMDMLRDGGHPELGVTVVTNGTILNPRIVRLLEDLPLQPTISLDGGTPEVYERIRVGGRFDQVMSNLETMDAIVSRRGHRASLTHCLMVDNWQTFPELLAIGERLDLEVAVNVVRFPEQHSLYHLSAPRLAAVIAGLEARHHEVERRLTGGRRRIWDQQLAALRGRLAASRWPSALGVAPEADRVDGVRVTLGPTRTHT